jgi:hypothetical protein
MASGNCGFLVRAGLLVVQLHLNVFGLRPARARIGHALPALVVLVVFGFGHLDLSSAASGGGSCA